MSGLEIERKFLVRKGDAYRRAAFSSSRIRQGYIPCDNATVRIRLRQQDESPSPLSPSTPPLSKQAEAFLTIKGRSIDGGLARYEFEKEITIDEAEHLLNLCRGGIIDKRRYLVRSGNHVFEVDEFYGDNEGLVMAEVELQSQDEPYEKPDFIGPEVTGDRRFYNKNMLRNPFCLWRESLPEEYR
ncbi:MAG: CYTH domain-containing protein [Prevotella sp.]|nr:CYTH domain-containing protein [Prevotella sp.]